MQGGGEAWPPGSNAAGLGDICDAQSGARWETPISLCWEVMEPQICPQAVHQCFPQTEARSPGRAVAPPTPGQGPSLAARVSSPRDSCLCGLSSSPPLPGLLSAPVALPASVCDAEDPDQLAQSRVLSARAHDATIFKIFCVR